MVVVHLQGWLTGSIIMEHVFYRSHGVLLYGYFDTDVSIIIQYVKTHSLAQPWRRITASRSQFHRELSVSVALKA